ncbi:hypothetical protein TNIN_304101 [Trichonephila inaurata madagascariensis]|uniref:Uncharacterized protein n=1 Tax=Trichonephila inaurata madagascariensis TaxID=2747483 RepID=A0A8X6KPD2_9ARAC|nr:hypothetical protein TNIN_304101 [Trichonephila inaurata madagascariensis]
MEGRKRSRQEDGTYFFDNYGTDSDPKISKTNTTFVIEKNKVEEALRESHGDALDIHERTVEKKILSTFMPDQRGKSFKKKRMVKLPRPLQVPKFTKEESQSQTGTGLFQIRSHPQTFQTLQKPYWDKTACTNPLPLRFHYKRSNIPILASGKKVPSKPDLSRKNTPFPNIYRTRKILRWIAVKRPE